MTGDPDPVFWITKLPLCRESGHLANQIDRDLGRAVLGVRTRMHTHRAREMWVLETCSDQKLRQRTYTSLPSLTLVAQKRETSSGIEPNTQRRTDR